MAQISLETSKLLGFRLLAAEADRTALLGAKVGGVKPEVTLGAKIGVTKFGAKVGFVKPIEGITA